MATITQPKRRNPVILAVPLPDVEKGEVGRLFDNRSEQFARQAETNLAVQAHERRRVNDLNAPPNIRAELAPIRETVRALFELFDPNRMTPEAVSALGFAGWQSADTKALRCLCQLFEHSYVVATAVLVARGNGSKERNASRAESRTRTQNDLKAFYARHVNAAAGRDDDPCRDDDPLRKDSTRLPASQEHETDRMLVGCEGACQDDDPLRMKPSDEDQLAFLALAERVTAQAVDG